VGTSARHRPDLSSGFLLQEKNSDILASRINKLFISDFLWFTKKCRNLEKCLLIAKKEVRFFYHEEDEDFKKMKFLMLFIY
jgi:hypothetical protein